MANKFTDATFNADLPMLEKSVLYVLSYRSNNDTGECWTSFSSIAKYAGIARSSAEKGVKALLDRGLISIVGKRQVRAGKPVNVYRLNLEKIQALAITATRYAPIPESGIGDEPRQSLGEAYPIPRDGTGAIPRDGAAITATRYLTLPVNSSRITRQAGNGSAAAAETRQEKNGTNLGETPNPQTQGRPLATPVQDPVMVWALTVSNNPGIKSAVGPVAYIRQNYATISRQYDKYHCRKQENEMKRDARRQNSKRVPDAPATRASREDDEDGFYFERHGHYEYQAGSGEYRDCEVCRRDEERAMRDYLKSIEDDAPDGDEAVAVRSKSFVTEDDEEG